jgi:8-amino-7-oxononanoate synthase
MPPAAAGAALAALDIIERDADLRARPLTLAARFCRAIDLPVPQSPIVPIVLGAPDAALATSQILAERGFLVAAIRPPTVPKGTARLRVTFSAAHTEAQVDGLVSAMRAVLQ